MSLLSNKTDAQGQDLIPGDVCVRVLKDKNNFNKGSLEFCVYKGETWGGSKSKGEFGRFVTPLGTRSIKYNSVVFVFDPLSERRARNDSVVRITRKFYEERK